MHETLIHLTALLNGEAVYYGSDTKQTTIDVLARLVESGDITEHRKGSSRWWSIDRQTVVYVQERRKAA